MCGNVCIEELGHVGAGAKILQSIRIGSRTLVSAGTLVKSDIEDSDQGVLVRDQEKMV